MEILSTNAREEVKQIAAHRNDPIVQKWQIAATGGDLCVLSPQNGSCADAANLKVHVFAGAGSSPLTATLHNFCCLQRFYRFQ